MRTIKFRAWNKEEKEMYYNAEQTYDYRCQGKGCFLENFGSVLKDERLEVMQYTGLKDKKGKEIYEGDIVKVEKIDWAYIYYDEDRMAWGIKPINEFYFDSPLLSENADLELKVIGNIYENPELLEESDIK